MFYTVMIFVCDKLKSDANKKKHGIDFIEAQALWVDERRIEMPARTEDEVRLFMEEVDLHES